MQEQFLLLVKPRVGMVGVVSFFYCLCQQLRSQFRWPAGLSSNTRPYHCIDDPKETIFRDLQYPLAESSPLWPIVTRRAAPDDLIRSNDTPKLFISGSITLGEQRLLGINVTLDKREVRRLIRPESHMFVFASPIFSPTRNNGGITDLQWSPLPSQGLLPGLL